MNTRGKRITAAVAAAVLVVAAASAAFIIGQSRQHTSVAAGGHPTSSAPVVTGAQQGSPVTATTSSPVTTVPLLPRGGQGSRADVPWSAVGPGWILSEWSASRPSTSTPPTTSNQAPSPTSLFLVDPLGGRYLLDTFGPGSSLWSTSLVAWSGDGTRALFSGAPESSSVAVMNLTTGAVNTFVPAGPGATGRGAGFTAPTGQGIIVDQQAASPTSPALLRRYTLTGNLELTYPTSFPDAGEFRGGHLYTPDGTQLVLGTTNGLELVTNGGQPVRFLPMGPSATGCSPLRWWSPTQVLVNCSVPDGHSLLWLVPTDGTGPVALTASPPAGSSDSGDLDAWHLPSGTYIEVASACAYRYAAKLGADHTTSPLMIPGVVNGQSQQVLGAHDERLALQIAPGPGCIGGSSLAWFNPTSAALTPLLGGAANGGDVGGAVLFGE